MYLTEEEAATKWCPHARQPGKVPQDNRTIVPLALNRPPKSMGMEGAPMCIGSACSQWRWKQVANPAWKPTGTSITFPSTENPFSQEPAGIDSTTHGRCGLAGH